MADVLPINFPIPQEGAVASYSFTDLVTKTGYIRYFLIKDSSGDGFLSPQSIASQTIDTQYSGTVSNQDLDFDVEFKSQQIIEGDCYLSLATLALKSGASGSMSMTVDVEIFHVNPSETETSLGSAEGAAVFSNSPAGGGSTAARYNLYKIPLTKHAFSIGDKLRLRLTTSTTADGGGTSIGAIGHDPIGRHTDYDSTTNGDNSSSEIHWDKNLNAEVAAEVTPDSNILLPFRIEF